MLILIAITIWLVIYTGCIIQLMDYRGYTLADINKPLLITALKWASSIFIIILVITYILLSGA